MSKFEKEFEKLTHMSFSSRFNNSLEYAEYDFFTLLICDLL